MSVDSMSESQRILSRARKSKEILDKFERAKVLEVYFSRLDGRVPLNVPSDHFELFKVDLTDMKNFLLGQHPQDTILQKIFRMMS